jgi:hypothetical protein
MSIKVASTPELIRLARVSTMRGYNRQLDPEWIEEFLDPSGAHVIEFLIPHEHAQGQPVPLHARCQVFLKVQGTMNPMQVFIDIPIDEFNALPTVDKEAVAV